MTSLSTGLGPVGRGPRLAAAGQAGIAPTLVHRVLWVTVLVTVVFILINTFVGGWPKIWPGSIAPPGGFGCAVRLLRRRLHRQPAPPAGAGAVDGGQPGVWALADIIDYLVPPLAKLGEAAYVGAYASTAVAVLWLVVQLRRMVGSTALVESLIGVVALSVAIGALVIYPRLLHDGAHVLAGRSSTCRCPRWVWCSWSPGSGRWPRCAPGPPGSSCWASRATRPVICCSTGSPSSARPARTRMPWPAPCR